MTDPLRPAPTTPTTTLGTGAPRAGDLCIVHGYLLDGSGSNLWTQAIVRTLCRAGETVHLVCQEPHPERFDFVARAIRYDGQARPEVVLDRAVPFEGRCVLHKPTLGDVLPVYVWDRYEEFERVVPMVELDDAAIEDYLRRNVAVLDRILAENAIAALHVNHAVLMSVAVKRAAEARRIPFAIMPHGSAIEYAVKKDPRFHRLASEAIAAAGRVFVIGPELRQRVLSVFAQVPDLEAKLVPLNLGVDTSLFEPIPPEQRVESIERFGQELEGKERGKGAEKTTTMRHRLGDTLSMETLRKVLSQAGDYTAKHPDVDCESKLAAVDWVREKVILFVGRLIASKGAHAMIAAMPEILAAEPRARLVVVGHGPLREPLEAMLWALDGGKRVLLDNIARWGKYLEGAREPEPLVHLQAHLATLEARGELARTLEAARKLHVSDRVLFTGYLTHEELRWLYPCCEVAVFPSIVAEAGPLVFLEALASGVFPLGIDIAGMAASIAQVSSALPPEAARLMKLRPEPEHTVSDIVQGTLGALALDRRHAGDLRRVAALRYDWSAVGETLRDTLRGLPRP
jgi:glycosyltransferase involved in cell wall biosynthesis